MSTNQYPEPLWKRCANDGLKAQLAGDLALAENNYRLSLKLARFIFGDCHEAVAEATITLSDFLSSHHRYLESDELYHKAIEIYDLIFGPDNLVSAMIYGILGEIYSLQESKTQMILLRQFMLKNSQQHLGREAGEDRRQAS